MLAVFWPGITAPAPGRSPKPTVESVSNQVYCVCGGCVAVLKHCPHLPSECSSRAGEEAMIQKEIAEGKDETAILQDMVLRYGVQVLAAPPAQGFFRTVWVLPGFGLIVGLTLVILIVRRWRRPRVEPLKTPPRMIDPKVMAAVEEEMKKIESLSD